MSNRYKYIPIPPNLGNGGGLLGGMVETRNAIEALVNAALCFFLYLMVRQYVSSAIITMLFLSLGVIGSIICLFGINGEPISLFLMNIFTYDKRRYAVTLKPPMPKLQSLKEEKPRKKLFKRT